MINPLDLEPRGLLADKRIRGSTISRLRVETGADIQVGKDDDLITITVCHSWTLLWQRVRTDHSDETSVNQGKDAILSIVNRSGGNRY